VSRDSEIEQLKLLIAKLRRMQFERSSEKLDRQTEQLELRPSFLMYAPAVLKGTAENVVPISAVRECCYYASSCHDL
jgi:hypothetical protein